MLLDPLALLAAAGAVVQLGRIAIRSGRKLIELASGERAETIEMWRKMAPQVFAEIQAKQRCKRWICVVQVDPLGVGECGLRGWDDFLFHG
jgi:hypothetical protein